jgi:putative phosphoribosyl transferase
VISPAPRFADRRAAGRELAERLRTFAFEDVVVLGLPRGGVPVAYEVAQALGATLDVLLARKIGAPDNPEYGIGAVAEGDVRVLNHAAVRRTQLSADELETAVASARAEIGAGLRRYRGHRPPLDLEGRTVIVVDDGLATGGTARAALLAARARQPRRLMLAVPVGARETVESLHAEAYQALCLLQPAPLGAVGMWYEHFEPPGDGEIAELLATLTWPEARRPTARVTAPQSQAQRSSRLVADARAPDYPAEDHAAEREPLAP